MKIIYILGLGHSGSTLTNHLLSSQPGVLGLGEVAQFFSPQHMRLYLRRWGSTPDVTRCSCGRSWETCPFWVELLSLSGLESNSPSSEKYRSLLNSVRCRFGDEAVIVDSSKSLEGLTHLHAGAAALGIGRQNIHVILTVKDVRSFVPSFLHQTGQRSTLPAVLRTMNLWLAAHRGFLRHLEATGTEVSINRYENLCADPLAFLVRELQRAGLPPPQDLHPADAGTSHILLSNKQFLFNKPSQIRYDSRWMMDDRINLAYLLHAPARAFNHHLHRLAV